MLLGYNSMSGGGARTSATRLSTSRPPVAMTAGLISNLGGESLRSLIVLLQRSSLVCVEVVGVTGMSEDMVEMVAWSDAVSPLVLVVVRIGEIIDGAVDMDVVELVLTRLGVPGVPGVVGDGGLMLAASLMRLSSSLRPFSLKSWILRSW
jgi:hypothetical protein